MVQLGKYELVRRLAVGGMAELYLARQSGLEGFEKTVVVKKLLPELAAEEDTVRMFLQEARFAAGLSHPNIVQIFDLGKADDDYFIAMEYVDGRDLRQCVERAEELDQPMPYPLAAFIVSCVCRALHHAHELRDRDGNKVGLVHRDVSPQNVLLGRSGDVKLVDFGIAKATNAATKTRAGLLKGKYAYMSPEQCRGEDLDLRSDIFSAGILLYELTCRRRLFKRENELATMHAVLEQTIPPPSVVSDDVPDELEMIAMRALQRDREGRYSSAEEMHVELRSAIRDNGWDVGPTALAGYVRALFADDDNATARSREGSASASARTGPGAPPRPVRSVVPPQPVRSVVPDAQRPPGSTGPHAPVPAPAAPPPVRVRSVVPSAPAPRDPAASAVDNDTDEPFGEEATVADEATLAASGFNFDVDEEAMAPLFADADEAELQDEGPATLIGTGQHMLPPGKAPSPPPAALGASGSLGASAPLPEVVVPAPAPALSPEPITGETPRFGANTEQDIEEATQLDRGGVLAAKLAAGGAGEADIGEEPTQARPASEVAELVRQAAAAAGGGLPKSGTSPAPSREVARDPHAATLQGDGQQALGAIPRSSRAAAVPAPIAALDSGAIKRHATEEEEAPTMIGARPADLPAAAGGPGALTGPTPEELAMTFVPGSAPVSAEEMAQMAEAMRQQQQQQQAHAPPPAQSRQEQMPSPASLPRTGPTPMPPEQAPPPPHPGQLAPGASGMLAPRPRYDPSQNTPPPQPFGTPQPYGAPAQAAPLSQPPLSQPPLAPTPHQPPHQQQAHQQPSPMMAPQLPQTAVVQPGGGALETAEFQQLPELSEGGGGRGWIIALIIAGVLLVGGGVAAALLLTRGGGGDGPKTKLLLRSNPPGAIVFINGNKRPGVTPMTLVDLPAGKELHIVLMAKHRRNWQKKVTLAANKPLALDAKLVPREKGGQATLTIVTPKDAEIYVDGERRGSGTQTIAVAANTPHVVLVKRKGMAHKTVNVPPLAHGVEKKLEITPDKKAEKIDDGSGRGGGRAGGASGGAGGGGGVEIPRGKANGIRAHGNTVPPAR